MKPLARQLCFSLLCGGFCFNLHAAGELVIARRGRPAEFTIVVRAQATECERYAADELRDFLNRLTGVELPIADDSAPLPDKAVLIGETRHTSSLLGAGVSNQSQELGDEGFRIKVTGDRLLVLGAQGRGPLYGVYELLERFGGCAWYSRRFEVVPRVDIFAVPDGFDEVQRPAFALRSQNGNDLRAHPRFAARNKMNLESFGPELGGSRFLFDHKLGKCHTFEALMPSGQWFAGHPEYYSEIDGRRRGFKTQLCLTNPEVRRICTEKVLERIAESYPKGIRYYGVSQNDWNTFCRCDRCAAVDKREKSHSGTLIEFVNHIAEAVERRYPDVMIQTLAYSYTRRPPATLVPRRNVHVCLCTIECDFARPIASSRSQENRQTLHSLRKWGGYPCELGVWDYSTDFACYLFPWPNFRSLRPNLELYCECGASQVFVQNDGAGVNDIWTDLRVWLIAKWMWNPLLDEELLLQRAFRDCFGPAAADVRRYFDELHGYPRNTRLFPMGCFELLESGGLPNICIDRAASHLARAAERVAGTPYEENVLLARLPVDFTRAMRGHARPFLLPDAGAIDPTRYAEEQDGARRIVSVLESPGGLRFAGDRAWTEMFRRRICEFASRERPVRAVRRLKLEEWNLVGLIPTSFETVDDPDARDGRAVLLPGSQETCKAWFWLDGVQIDFNGTYMPRLRIRVGDGDEGEEAFNAGVYNRFKEIPVLRIVESMPPRHLSAGKDGKGRYTWYSLGAFSPRRGDAIWIGLGRGPRRPDVWIDCISLERIN